MALLVGCGILCGAAGRDVIYPNVTVEAVDLGGMTKGRGPGGLGEGCAGSSLDETRGVAFTVSTDQGEIQTVEVPLSSVAIDYAATVERAWAVGRDASFLARGGWYLKCLNQGSEICTGLPEQRQPGDHFGDHSGSAGPRAGGPQLGGQRDGPGPGERHPRQQSGSAGHRGPDLSAPGGERHRHPLRGAGTV
ncbi:MAG: hypothetical protein ACLUNZ_06070 [Evtepia sp.]